jgi:hypothetical protein
MPTVPPPVGEPHARGTVLHGFRAAVEDLWGERAVADLAARLPLATRLATIDTLVLPFEWIPIDLVIAWHEAMWAGPARADERELARLVARSIDLGLGRFRAAFFAGVTRERLVERAQELWRWQHTHGDVTVSVEETSGTVVLTGHPYVDHATCRRLTAESYRAIVALALGEERDVRVAWGTGPAGGGPPSSHPRPSDPRALVVQLNWRA